MALRRTLPPKSSELRGKTARRGRPPTIDSEKLLEVAREVFLERGIRATTLEVAERAGVSEGAVFHRFKSKEGLFRAAMHLDEDDVPQLFLNAVQELDGLVIEEALLQLATALLEIGRVALPLMMMSWSNPDRCGATPFDKKKAGYHDFLKRLARYFETEMEEGRLRRMDAEVMARVFLGSVHHYCMTRIVVNETDGIMIPEGMFVRGLVDLLLHGALPSERSSVSPRRFQRN